MKHIFRNALLLILFATVIIPVFSQTAREIADQASNAIDFPSMEMASTLKIFDAKGRERVRKLVTATNKFSGITKTLIKFTAPADVKGTSMLVYDNKTSNDDMWIFLPALRKTRRIVSSEKGKSFMGSEFTNADMSKPNLDDFTYKTLKEQTFNEKACWVVEATCKDEDIEDENGFMRQVSWIEKETFLCHKVEYYDLDDELHKIQIIRDYRRQSGGGYFAFYLEKQNLQNRRKSIMTIDKFQENCSMPESAFSPNMLSR